MNFLLNHLRASGQSLHMDFGSTAHADNIRAASNFTYIQNHIFLASISLTLKPSRAEAVTFSIGPFSSKTTAGTAISTQSTTICLGVWWQHDPSPC